MLILKKKSTILTVSALIWLRWLISALPGYIHPDEFFQNPEITSSTIFKLKTLTPWEYQPQHAARSIVSPFITTGIPFYILKAISNDSLPSSYSLFTAERLGSFIYSLIIDICVYKICKKIKAKPLVPMLLVATSQVTLAYTTRPFSNSFESILLCLSLATYVNIYYASSIASNASFLLGALFSLGVFTRITFPLYAMPIGLAYLYQVYKKRAIFALLSFIFGILAFAVFSIVADSVYFGTLKITFENGDTFRNVGDVASTLFNPVKLLSVRPEGTLAVAPWNNLMYNLNVDNLAQHGLHPRYTHFAVNLPLLFGPLAIFGFLYIPQVLSQLDVTAHVFYVCLGVVFSGLIGLSIMPHQEARFLCPLLVPLVLIYTWKQSKLPTSFWTAWILFNIITTYIFGVVHQGGLISSMSLLHKQTSSLHDCRLLKSGDLTCLNGDNSGTLSLQDNIQLTTNLIFYKTYMPPHHLLVIPNKPSQHQINVLDFSSRLDNVASQLEHATGVSFRRHAPNEIDFAPTSKTSYERTLLITPSFIALPKIEKHRYMLLAAYTPHVSFDDMDIVMERAQASGSPEGQMSLNVFLILSDKDSA